MECNPNILCDVCTCCHNCGGKTCSLQQIKVTTDCTDCTCCDSFCYKENIDG